MQKEVIINCLITLGLVCYQLETHCATAQVTLPIEEAPFLCGCGEYVLGQEQETFVSTSNCFLKKPDNVSSCRTKGLCRKRMEKNGAETKVFLECLNRTHYPPAPGNHFITGELELPTACITDKWWKEAVTCCRSIDNCNRNLKLCFGGFLANPLFSYGYAHHKDIYTKCRAGTVNHRKNIHVAPGFPCRRTSDCAWTPPKRIPYCLPKYIEYYKGLRNVCCAALIGEEAPITLKNPCCGEGKMECKEKVGDPNVCVCAKAGVTDGTPCKSESDCSGRRCKYDYKVSKKTCCSVETFNDRCNDHARCCYGVCMNGYCTLLPDGFACDTPAQCLGDRCAEKTLNSGALNQGKLCCTLDAHRPCNVTDIPPLYDGQGYINPIVKNAQCCGDLECVKGSCKCQTGMLTEWSEWTIPPSETMYEACTNATKLKSRTRKSGSYCGPSIQFSDLTKPGKYGYEDSNCPSDNCADLKSRFVEPVTVLDKRLGYVGCYTSENRFLTKFVEQRPMDPRLCYFYCWSFHLVYKIAGVMNKTYCGCAHQVYSYNWGPVVQDETKCNIPCEHNPELMCGGVTAASVYSWDII